MSFLMRRKVTFDNIKLFKGLSKKEKRSLLIVNVLSSFFLAVNWYLFIYVMNNISVNATSLAYMLCPIITTILAYIFLNVRLSQIQCIAIAFSALSCLILAFGNFMDLFYSFIIGLSYAIYLILQKNNQRLDRFFTLTFQMVCGTIMLLPLYNFQQAEPEKGLYVYGVVALIAMLFTILPMYLNVYSLNRLMSCTDRLFIYMNLFICFGFALFYLKEEMATLIIIAYSIVFLSVVLFNIKVLLQLIRIKKA